MAGKKKVEITATETVEVAKPASVPALKLNVSYIVTDRDGVRTRMSLDSTGSDAKELLDGIELSPKNFGGLVLLTYTKGGRSLERSIPYHKSQAILVNRNVEVFNALFRGL